MQEKLSISTTSSGKFADNSATRSYVCQADGSFSGINGGCFVCASGSTLSCNGATCSCANPPPTTPDFWQVRQLDFFYPLVTGRIDGPKADVILVS